MPLSRFASTLALATLTMAIVPAGAQNPPAAAGDSPHQRAAPALPTLNLDFPGGTALEYVAAVRKADPSANVVVLGDLGRIKMAAVQLKNVDVSSALRVLDQLPPEQGDVIARVRVENVATSMPAVFAVIAEIKNRGPGAGTLQTTVISMSDLLGENLKAADALTAIETALGLIKDSNEPAQIKFHEQTGLLICRGTAEQIETIRQVNSQLRERAGVLESREAQKDAERRNAEQMKANADGNAKMRETNEQLTQELTQYRTKAEVLERTVDQLQKQIAAMQDQVRAAQAERDSLQMTIANLQAKIKEGKP